MRYTVGVTGHRTLKGKEEKVREKFKELLLPILEAHKEEGVEVNTGMALGFDQLVCRACVELGVPYVAAVPCEAQDALWAPVQKELYSMLIEGADRVVLVTPGPYEAWKMHARNAWIVKNSKEMIVHWDGIYSGGTGQCMKLVKAKKLPYQNTVIL